VSRETTPYEQWDSSAEWYDQNMGAQGDVLNREVLRPVVLELLGHLDGLRLLDCGCGSGYLSGELASRCSRVLGTDFSERFVELCRRKYAAVPNLEFQQLDLTAALPFPAGSFDVVLCKMVLQYVPEIGTFARESRRVLAAGGCLVVVVEHPFHSQFLYAQQLAGKPDPKEPELGHYWDSTPRRKLSLWGRVELTWHPRTLADYLQAFLGAGFRLAALRELPEQRNGVTIPRILALRLEGERGEVRT
jgi:ubiquinone/menaquinone biosynthesis C-methylase UbiE